MTVSLVLRMWWMWMLTKRPRLGPWQCWVMWVIGWCAHPTSRNSSDRWKLSIGWVLGVQGFVVLLWKKALGLFIYFLKLSDCELFFCSVWNTVLWSVLGANTCWWFAHPALVLRSPHPSAGSDAQLFCAQFYIRSCMDLSSFGIHFISHTLQFKDLYYRKVKVLKIRFDST